MKYLMVILALVSLKVNASGYFSKSGDICDSSCNNNYNDVRNLQITLNKDLNLSLKTDGRFGNNTKNAVIDFQKKHNLEKANGWVGSETKRELNIAAQNIAFPKNKVIAKSKSGGSTHSGSYNSFLKKTNLRKSYKVYKNNALLRKANGSNTKIKIDISEQRLRLYVNGKVAVDSPATTGSRRKLEPNTGKIRDMRTPKGNFKIIEKIADKRSTIFGDYYRGSKRVYHGDKRKYKGSRKGLRYKGASLRNWMRLTSDGIGIHASKYVKRNPGSNGCIRLPPKVAKVIFSKVKRGTRVSITQ